MEKEIWKDVKGFEGLYQVSSFGMVKSLPKNGRKAKILVPIKDRGGYYYTHLCKNGKCAAYKMHRLVALTFLPNPHSFQTVNHVDGDKTNNRVNNLEWCSLHYNLWHERNILKITGRVPKKVLCVETGEIFNTAKDAANNVKVCKQMISFACCGRRKTAGGYHWRYL